ncbi:hypothetical protein JMUB5695_01221 [Mycobacterium heckeshornense]|nr:hypothetical protein JMUB5695_01221 [Mycobacterium heckeshornense]
MTVTEIRPATTPPMLTGRGKAESLYGVAKMWAHLQRRGIPVAKCTAERLMRANGWAGVRRVPDLVDRKFAVDAPNRLLVADFTYVRLVTGMFVYTAFVGRRLCRADLGLGVLDSQTGLVRRIGDPPGRGCCGPVKATRWRG